MRRDTTFSLGSLAGVVVLLLAAACVLGTGPGELTDAVGLHGSLAVVDTIFGSPVARSVGIFSYGTPIPPPVGTAPVIPDSLLGTTFAWTCAGGYRRTMLLGAPARGVRFVLYQLAPDGSLPCPATVIGQLDLVDASSPDAVAVRATASAVGGSPTYVDYTLRRVVTDPLYAVSARGTVSDGRRSLDFSLASRPSPDQHGGVEMMTVDAAALDVHQALYQAAQMGVDTYSDDIQFTLRHGTTTLGLQGTFHWFNTLRSWDEIVTVNSLPFAKVGGSGVPEGGGPTFTRLLPGPGVFSDDERQLLLALVVAPRGVSGDVDRVLGPAVPLVR